MKLNSVFIILIFEIFSTYAWDSEDLEVFDGVEEVGENFYTLLGVPKDASASEIKKAFRKLSLIVHPDKNSAPDAELKFRQLATVYDILKNPKKRAKYNDVLEHGLPDWKQVVYYYRRVRKMGVAEMLSILFIIITIGQYLVAWAAYFERKYTIEEIFKSKKPQKRQKKGKTKDMEMANMLPEIMAGLPKPSVSCTLPCQIVKLTWFMIVGAPPLTYRWIKQYYQERQRRKEEETQKLEEPAEEEIVPHRERGPRRRKVFTVPELHEDNITNIDTSKQFNEKKSTVDSEQNYMSGGLWTDDDFVDLLRLTKKFPPGTHERWERIGAAMKRPSHEVAHMAHRIKDEGFKPIIQQSEESELKEEEPKKVKTKGSKIGEDVEESNWTQAQQKAFEQALATYPKGSATDRWEKIAKCVPGKTKEECMVRFKNIVARVKKKKDAASNNENNTVATTNDDSSSAWLAIEPMEQQENFPILTQTYQEKNLLF
uniref:Putative chaperone protein dnaj n=1 Tax=Panstrongylus lignarius TaxID=156445 RepID=A0A224XBK2_9HEMI